MVIISFKCIIVIKKPYKLYPSCLGKRLKMDSDRNGPLMNNPYPSILLFYLRPAAPKPRLQSKLQHSSPKPRIQPQSSSKPRYFYN